MININEWVNVHDLMDVLEEDNYVFDKDRPTYSMNDIFNAISKLKRIKPKTKRVIYFEEEEFDGEESD